MKSQMTQWRYKDNFGSEHQIPNGLFNIHMSLKLYISQHFIIVGLSKERQKRRVMKSEKLMDNIFER